MDETFSTIRGLINDLVRTLTAAMVHMDDLLLNLGESSNEYDDAWLVNQQLGRALEFFFEIRSELLLWQKYDLNKRDDIYHQSLTDEANHILSNIITLVDVSCDILLSKPKIFEKNNIISNLSKSMDYYRQIINRNILLRSATSDKRLNEANQNKNQGKCLENNRKILLIEDELEVRNIINRGLCYYGYEVFDCETGEEGLSIFESEDGDFVLSIVDIVLPDINGGILGQQFSIKKPDIKIIFTSGYDKHKLSGCSIDNVNYQFLSKPFGLQTLLKMVIKLTKKAPILSIPCPMIT